MGVRISEWDNGLSVDPLGGDRIPSHRDPTNAVTTWARVYTWIKAQLDLVYSTLGLGETSTTAYRGDRGKTAYDHSQVAHAPVALSGAKSSATDAGTFGDISLTDDYVYYCVQTGTAGNAIWKKSVMFQT
jgi:hypothetical protein